MPAAAEPNAAAKAASKKVAAGAGVAATTDKKVTKDAPENLQSKKAAAAAAKPAEENKSTKPGAEKGKKDSKPVESAEDKAAKLAYKEGGKKGQDITGMSDMGGVKYFTVAVESANGDLQLLDQVLAGMNKEVDEAAEERKGGAGGLGKMLLSAGDIKLAIVVHVPPELASDRGLTADEWLMEVLPTVSGRVVDRSGDVIRAEAVGDPQKGLFPLKM